ncbi:MAG: ergothioneine biosynthesis protein EgtB [Phycisphaeraceae bacterium]
MTVEPSTTPQTLSATTPASQAGALLDRFLSIRGRSIAVAEPLDPEDCVVQSMTETSPIKWHLAHTTWFFEAFVLQPHRKNYRPFDADFNYLFNSYYNTIGDRQPRPSRGMLTRPTMKQVLDYRKHVDRAVARLCDREELHKILEIGLQHEQQHQELMLTDVKHLLSLNPIQPPYRTRPTHVSAEPSHPLRASDNGNRGAGGVEELNYITVPHSIFWLGHRGVGFAFDNEGPRHKVYLDAFEIGDRLITNAEYLAFMADGGYERPELWLDEGWQHVQSQGWRAPLYWRESDGSWEVYTLDGTVALAPDEPVCHISFFEADAYARWAGARLPTEAEWEAASVTAPIEGHFAEADHLHPQPVASTTPSYPRQMFGDVWQWTASAYLPYRGFRPPAGALGEYNGKFMCNQFVLRGGSCVTPRSHIRRTYRNFFPPESRWQFSGIRLALDQ